MAGEAKSFSEAALHYEWMAWTAVLVFLWECLFSFLNGKLLRQALKVEHVALKIHDAEAASSLNGYKCVPALSSPAL